MYADMRRALVERRDLIEARANTVPNGALLTGAQWSRTVRIAPQGPMTVSWRQRGRTVAAFETDMASWARQRAGHYPADSIPR